MPKRRDIREAAIQFLYCADLEGGADPAAIKDTFWEFVTESDRRSLLLATFRTVHHLSQGRSSRIAEFHKRHADATTQIAAWPEAEPLASALKRMAKLEAQWTAKLESMARLSKDGDDAEIVQRFSSPLHEFFINDRALAEQRSLYLAQLEDHPQLQKQLEPVTATIRRLQRISDRVRMVEEPEQFPDQAELASLRQSKSKICELKNSANALVDAIIADKQAIDEKLAQIVENYAPQRIDPVDRAILRLATHEIMSGETPVKVVFNEAIELAKRFGTSDSGRFVNGVLDRLATTLDAQRE